MQGRQDFRNFVAVWRHGFAIAILWIFLNYTGMCWQINPVYAVMHMIYGIGLVYLVTKGKFKGTWLMIIGLLLERTLVRHHDSSDGCTDAFLCTQNDQPPLSMRLL